MVRTTRNKRRSAFICGATASLTVAMTLPAHAADIVTTIRNFSPGMESRRWNDSQFSQITFIGCGPRGARSVQVKMRQDKAWQPDPHRGTKTCTKCFRNTNPASYSRGTWHKLPKGKYYFQIGSIKGAKVVDVYQVRIRPKK